MEGRHLSIEKKGVIIGMSHSGMSQHSIATELGIPPSTIEYVLKRYRNFGTLVIRKVIR